MKKSLSYTRLAHCYTQHIEFLVEAYLTADELIQRSFWCEALTSTDFYTKRKNEEPENTDYFFLLSKAAGLICFI